MQNKINIREIAKLCGVSPATVSRAMNKNAPVSEETRKKIEQAIQDTGYVLQKPPLPKDRKKTRTIGVFAPVLGHAFFQFVLDQLHALVAARGDYMIILPEKDPETVERVRKMGLDGIVLLSEETSNNVIESIQKMHISTVICGALSLSRLCPAVHVDDLAAAYDGTNYLLGLGHRKIGFICDSPRSISSGFQRMAGSRKAMEDSGLAFQEDCVFNRSNDYASGYDGAAALIKKHPELTAIFAHSDAAAIGAMAALMDRGLSVPKDISVLGFDDIHLGEKFRPRLTCVSQPIHDIVLQSLDLLYAGMEQTAWEVPPTITLPHSITIRDSCQPPAT